MQIAVLLFHGLFLPRSRVLSLFRSDTPENKFHYPHGVGLNPTALFMQSGLGIVTGAVIKLIPKPQALLLIEADFLTVNLPVRGPLVWFVRVLVCVVCV